MEPKAFAETVKKTAMPANATTEEFAAFMMVAKEYNLNPLLKEIHAFPKKGGGIVPVVSIDGWVSLINQNPMLDGFEFEMHYSDKSELVACTCRMYRKDRQFPTVVTEYLSECYRATEPWKMKHRMLRHKALIQAARYCFGFSGIMDDDEAGKIAEMRDITPPSSQRPQLSQFVPPAQNAEEGERSAEETDDPVHQDEKPMPEFGPADAMEMGRVARQKGAQRKAIPGEWRDGTPEHDAWVEAWQAGWDGKDEEIKAKSHT